MNTPEGSINSSEFTPLTGIFALPEWDVACTEASTRGTEGALNAYQGIGLLQAERHFHDAVILEQRNDRTAATLLLRWCVSAYPDHFRGWLHLARLVSGQEALKAYRRAFDLAPGNVDAGVGLASQLINHGQRKEAAAILERIVLPANLLDFDLAIALASLWWQLGNYTAAEPLLVRCVEMNRSDMRAYQMLLEMFNRQDRLSELEIVCKDYLQAHSTDPFMLQALAGTLIRQQRWEDAETTLWDLLRTDPSSIPIRQLFASMMEKRGQGAGALEVLEENIRLQPNAIEVHLALVDAQYRLLGRDIAARTCNTIAQQLMDSAGWGLNILPVNLQQRVTFYQFDAISEHYCTGRRAVFDNTGISLDQSNYALGEVVELFCMVVGQEHIDYLEYVAAPALFATDGFDRLLAERTVVYNIYTTPADYAHLQSFLTKLTQKGIPYRVNVELMTFSQELYSILALPILDQIKRSLALRSAVVMALPDAIISGSIYRVLCDMKPSETVVCAMPRIDSEAAYPYLRDLLSASPNTGLNTREFVRKAMTDFRHPQTYSALTSENRCLRYQDQGTYYSARNWAPPPLCFYARPEMIEHITRNPLCGPHSLASFYTIDHDVVDSAYRNGNLRLIPDSDYFFWAELTHPARHTDFLAGRKLEDYYAPESSRFIFEHEFKWIYGG